MKQQPTAINGTLWQVLDSLKVKDEICSKMIQDSWEFVLGTTLAQNSEFMSYHNSVLEIRVNHPTWQKEFQHLAKDIITKFNNQLGTNLVSSIHCIK